MTTVACRRCHGVAAFPSWLFWWSCVITWTGLEVGGLKVKFGVILPVQQVSRTVHPCTTLPIAMAEEWLIADDLIPFNWVVDSHTSSRSSDQGRRRTSTAISIQFEYRDSRCSDTYGPVNAMEIYYHRAGCRTAQDNAKSRSNIESLEVQVFYGPCCKYALSPVGRYANVWNVPVITPGGLTSRFGDPVDYAMLTRFIAPFEKVAESVKLLLAKYGWWHLSFLFHDNIGPDKWKGYPMCYDIMEAVAALIHARDERTPQTDDDEDDVTPNNGTSTENQRRGGKCCIVHREIFNENYYEDYDFDVIMDEIRNASRGK